MSPTKDVSVSEQEQRIEQILQAASKHDNEKLQDYLNKYSFTECEAVDVLDPITNRCPLHVAVATCANTQNNGEATAESCAETGEGAGAETVRLLLENGAIWNQLDSNYETPGCLANRLGLSTLYALMVDAGVRAEIILNRLEGYEKLDEANDTTAAGAGVEDDDVVPELIVADGGDKSAVPEVIVTDVNSSDYLSSTLSFTKDKLLDDQNNGVMMEWERSIMEKSAESIMNKPGPRILNIGAGMLIFDSIVQASSNKPESHHIIEAHPDVLSDMRAKGWYEKPGVVIHEGKWQDVLPDLVAQDETFDAIYFDTFAESYAQFKDFFEEQVIGLLKQDGRWSFFNGMGADRQISYDVYQKVVEMDLLEAGFDVDWEDIEIPVLSDEWEGVKRKYWNINTYRLPVCKFMD